MLCRSSACNLLHPDPRCTGDLADADVSVIDNGYVDGMTVIGFHCSHEQINPAQLLQDVQRAEAAGFTAGMSSDHFSPWSARQGESGFAWAFLGAALATTELPFGVVNAPGQRYHPAIISQAIATLAQMFPGRFWACLLYTSDAADEL